MRKILNIIAWVALTVGVVMIIWRIFGNSPTDIQIISPFIVFGLVKVWDISNELKDFKHGVKLSFMKIKEDFKSLKYDLVNKK